MSAVIYQFLRMPVLWWLACRKGPVRFANVVRALWPHVTGIVVAGGALSMWRAAGIENRWVELIGGIPLSYLVAAGVIAITPAGRFGIIKDIEFARFMLKQLWNKFRRKAMA